MSLIGKYGTVESLLVDLHGVDSRKLTHKNFKIFSRYILTNFNATSVVRMGAKIALQAIRQHVDGDSQHLERLIRDIAMFRERTKFEEAVRPLVSKVVYSGDSPGTALLEQPGIEGINFHNANAGGALNSL